MARDFSIWLVLAFLNVELSFEKTNRRCCGIEKSACICQSSSQEELGRPRGEPQSSPPLSQGHSLDRQVYSRNQVQIQRSPFLRTGSTKEIEAFVSVVPSLGVGAPNAQLQNLKSVWHEHFANPIPNSH